MKITDNNDYYTYTRYGADNWSIRMGESDEPLYDTETIEELEEAFQNWVVENKI